MVLRDDVALGATAALRDVFALSPIAVAAVQRLLRVGDSLWPETDPRWRLVEAELRLAGVLAREAPGEVAA